MEQEYNIIALSGYIYTDIALNIIVIIDIKLSRLMKQPFLIIIILIIPNTSFNFLIYNERLNIKKNFKCRI